MSNIFPGLSASFGVLIIGLCSHSVEAQWVKEPSEKLMKQTPGLVHEMFESVSMKTTVGYSVVLPPSYKTSKKRFPVVYWLHGGGGNECSSLFTSHAWNRLYLSRKIGEVILVYPNGFRSGYMDHHDGKVMIETMIIRELIPRIDKQYRTVATRQGRAVHGFSMGASGSLKFAVKYPDLFCAAVGYGGGAVDLEHSKSRFILDILERNLKSDPELIRQNNTYHFLEKNHEVLRKSGLRVLLICGDNDSWKGSAVTFQTALRHWNIPCELTLVPNVGHNIRALSDAEGEAAALFQDHVFRKPTALTQVEKEKAIVETASTVNESYISHAEGRSQGFQVVLPPGFNQEVKYPLFVQVFGGANLLPTRERPFIRIRPSGRGVWGYRSMSRYDVMAAIERTKEKYSIDEDRVYITGTSAGATGIMHTVAQRPDVFAGAVPLVAFGNDLPLENFRNLPIRCEHGVNDWTSSIGNVRVQFQKLKALGYDTVLNEHPSAGHGIRVPPPETMDWLFACKRNLSPKQITYSCEHPRDGRAYWIQIKRFVDPHQIARIDAVSGDEGVTVNTANVRRFSIDLTLAPIRSTGQVVIDGESLELVVNTGQKDLDFIRTDSWRIASNSDKASVNKKGTYAAGAAANLFQGEPLLIVYGTGADERTNRFLQELATALSRTGGPTFKPASVRFPVKSDVEIEEVSLENTNLILVGDANSNLLLKRFAVELPYRIDDGFLKAGSRKPLLLKGAVLGFHYFNPEHPERTIYVVSPFLNESENKQCLSNPRKFLAGADGFKMIDQPDLLVRGVDLRIRREMQFDDDWKFIPFEGADKPVPEKFSDRQHLAIAHMKVMQQTADADFAIWWGPEDKGLFGGYDFNWLPAFDPASYTVADYAVRHRETETMTAELSGEEMSDIFDRWIAKQELITWPVISRQDIDVDRRYRIVIPMDLVPKLGIRRKVLGQVAPGPDVMPAQIFD